MLSLKNFVCFLRADDLPLLSILVVGVGLLGVDLVDFGLGLALDAK
jgi:hypothetical protein